VGLEHGRGRQPAAGRLGRRRAPARAGQVRHLRYYLIAAAVSFVAPNLLIFASSPGWAPA
jgi:hypothetical protein